MKFNEEYIKIIYDSREKQLHIVETLNRNGIETEKRKLDTGDYMIEYDGELLDSVVVERKGTLDELIGNLLDKKKDAEGNNRFMRELNRALEQGIKIYLVIEDKDYYLKLISGQYRSKVNSKAITGMVISLLAKYPNLHIIAVNKKESPSMIYKLLMYELREHLKNK